MSAFNRHQLFVRFCSFLPDKRPFHRNLRSSKNVLRSINRVHSPYNNAQKSKIPRTITTHFAMQSSTSAAVASLEDTALIEKTRAFVENYMSAYDGSHDYSHIKRVLALAQHILSVESQTHPEGHYNPTVVTLGALLHDVGDHKYPAKDIDPLKQVTLVQDTLISLGAPTTLAQAVQKITKNVSFSHEKANEDLVRQVLNEYPELAVVQDADRLDALGAVGVGRAFTYGGAMQRDMQQSIGHITEKREGVEQMMKTEEGKKLAAERINRLRTFRKWFDEEEEFGARDGR